MCLETCISCKDGKSCVECKKGFYKNGDLCIPCSDTCYECTDNSTNCISCQADKFLRGKICEDNCHISEYFHVVEKRCKTCPKYCRSC